MYLHSIALANRKETDLRPHAELEEAEVELEILITEMMRAWLGVSRGHGPIGHDRYQYSAYLL